MSIKDSKFDKVIDTANRLTSTINKHVAEEDCKHTIKEICKEALS